MSELVKKVYDEKAETYDEEFEHSFFKVYDVITWKYLEPYLPKNTDAVVLDAGGGTGRWSIPMAKKGLDVVLVDISEGMLDVASRKIKGAGLEDKITIEQGDISKLEYPDETFDLVFCEHALFLFEEPGKVIRELSRVLKGGCPLIISCPNTYTRTLMILKDKFPKHIDTAMSTMDGSFTFARVKSQCLTPIGFRKMLKNNGLEVEKIVGKVIAILSWSKKFLGKKKVSQDLLQRLLKMEMELCERDDALGLAGHLQAIAYKK